jgi:hypothetical protein
MSRIDKQKALEEKFQLAKQEERDAKEVSV